MFSLFSDFLPALSIGSAYPEPTGHGAVNAGRAGQLPRAQGSVETSRPRKHPTQHAATVTAVGAEGKSWRDDSLVKSSLSHSERGKRKGIFQVAEPMSGKFSFQKVLEPRSSDTKLCAFATTPRAPGAHSHLDVIPHLGRMWAESLGRGLVS